MKTSSYLTLLYLMLLLLSTDCTGANPSYDPCTGAKTPCAPPSPPPGPPPSTFSLLTQALEKQQGGTLEFTLPLSETMPPLLLNQPSATESYVLAKLVQPAVASLDLTLVPGKEAGHFVAAITPQDLASFHVGETTLQVSTAIALHTQSLQLQ